MQLYPTSNSQLIISTDLSGFTNAVICRIGLLLGAIAGGRQGVLQKREKVIPLFHNPVSALQGELSRGGRRRRSSKSEIESHKKACDSLSHRSVQFCPLSGGR